MQTVEMTCAATPGEAGSGGALQSGRSNVRHIKGILPVVYAPRYMDMATKSANEIMFATGNANKLREVSSNNPAAPVHAS